MDAANQQLAHNLNQQSYQFAFVYNPTAHDLHFRQALKVTLIH